MVEFLHGGSFLAAAVIALFFLRFWRDSGDRFFGFFALAFAILAVITDVDLSPWRAATNFAGLAALLYGLTYDRRPGGGR